MKSILGALTGMFVTPKADGEDAPLSRAIAWGKYRLFAGNNDVRYFVVGETEFGPITSLEYVHCVLFLAHCPYVVKILKPGLWKGDTIAFHKWHTQDGRLFWIAACGCAWEVRQHPARLGQLCLSWLGHAWEVRSSEIQKFERASELWKS